MLKFMKYEIRGTYRFILGVLVLAFILITGIYYYVTKGNSAGGNIFIGLSVLLLFGVALVTFLYIVGSFRKELYEDTGYLTFTLPLTGNQIVASKLIVALLWFFLLGLMLALYNLLMLRFFVRIDFSIIAWLQTLRHFLTNRQAVALILGAVIFGISLLLLIYFSITLSRVTFRNKKIGNFWFIIFLVLSALLSYGQMKVAAFVPYYLDLTTLNIGTLASMDILHMTIEQGAITITSSQYINLAVLLYKIIVIIALFLGTGFLIERKIDL